MQIRDRHGKVALLRATYDAEDKRTRQVSLGTFNVYGVDTFDQVPLEIREKLAAAEAEQLAEFLRARAEDRAKNRAESELRRAGKTLETVAAALESDGETTIENLRTALAAVDRIAKAIKKRGLKKKDMREKKLQPVPSNQTPLF